MSESAPDRTALTPEQKWWRMKVLISTYLAYVGYYFCRKVYGLIKTSLHEDFGWEYDAIGAIWTYFLVAYMIGQFTNGYIGRRFGPRVLLVGGLGVSIVCNVVFGLNSNYWVFAAIMFVNGLVQATGWPGAVGGVSHWIRPFERGRVMGIWGTSFIVGNLIVKWVGSLLLGVHVLGLAPWRVSYFGCTAIGLSIWLLVVLWQRDKPEDIGLEPIVDVAKDAPGRAIRASNAVHATFEDYLKLAMNPLILAMGLGYFNLKFLRYALDSWLPTFLNLQGLTKTEAGIYSTLFDLGGILPAMLAGYILDRYFRGNWARLCLYSGFGLMGGYVCVLIFEANPIMVAISFGLVGFMLYGPDSMLCGAASVAVAGERNAVAVAGIINGIGSCGAILQEVVIGKLLASNDDKMAQIHQANLLAFTMSVFFFLMMLVVMWRVKKAHSNNRAADERAAL